MEDNKIQDKTDYDSISIDRIFHNLNLTVNSKTYAALELYRYTRIYEIIYNEVLYEAHDNLDSDTLPEDSENLDQDIRKLIKEEHDELIKNTFNFLKDNNYLINEYGVIDKQIEKDQGNKIIKNSLLNEDLEKIEEQFKNIGDGIKKILKFYLYSCIYTIENLDESLKEDHIYTILNSKILENCSEINKKIITYKKNKVKDIKNETEDDKKINYFIEHLDPNFFPEEESKISKAHTVDEEDEIINNGLNKITIEMHNLLDPNYKNKAKKVDIVNFVNGNFGDNNYDNNELENNKKLLSSIDFFKNSGTLQITFKYLFVCHSFNKFNAEGFGFEELEQLFDNYYDSELEKNPDNCENLTEKIAKYLCKYFPEDSMMLCSPLFKSTIINCRANGISRLIIYGLFNDLENTTIKNFMKEKISEKYGITLDELKNHLESKLNIDSQQTDINPLEKIRIYYNTNNKATIESLAFETLVEKNKEKFTNLVKNEKDQNYMEILRLGYEKFNDPLDKYLDELLKIKNKPQNKDKNISEIIELYDIKRSELNSLKKITDSIDTNIININPINSMSTDIH